MLLVLNHAMELNVTLNPKRLQIKLSVQLLPALELTYNPLLILNGQQSNTYSYPDSCKMPIKLNQENAFLG